MKKSFLFSFIAAAFLLFASIGCKKEGLENPGGNGGNGGNAGGAPNLTIETVSGPTKEPCGGFKWQVKFNLNQPSAKGGWIVQKITYERNIIKCPNTAFINDKVTYWEAWRVAAGASGDSERLAGKFNFDDQYSSPNYPNTRGSITITGKVQFFEDLQLPAGFTKRNPATYAGDLPSTADQPAFWNENNAADHNLSFSWDCCDPAGIPILVTTATQVKPQVVIPADTGRLDNTGKMILQIPSWVYGYTPTQSIQLVNISRQLKNTTSPSSLHNSLVNFEKVMAASSEYDEQMSKVYLALRVIYQLPLEMPKTNAQHFGGWTHPCVATGSAYNMTWPVYATQSPSGWQVSVSDFTGFIGRGYDAAAELDYFNANFQKRNL